MDLWQLLTSGPLQIAPTALDFLVGAAMRQREGKPLDPQGVSSQFGLRPNTATPRLQLVGTTAVLPIVGLLMPRVSSWASDLFWATGTEQLEQDFRQAVGDTRVQKIVLLVDSPGGSALGNEEVAQSIFAARGKKPITAVVRGMCASAAYYLASGAEQIIATPSSLVGSVGTIMTHVEISKFAEELGYKFTVITHGDKKGHGNQVSPLTPESKATLQQMVDAYGDQFDAACARHRGVSAADVRSKFGGGQVFIAGEAQKRGLIDQVGAIDGLLKSDAAADTPVERQAADRVLVQGQSLGTVAAIGVGELFPGWSPGAAMNYELAAATAQLVQPPQGSAAQADQPILKEETKVKFSKNLKAAMYMHGLLQAADVEKAFEIEDVACWQALVAHFNAKGQEVPDGEKAIIAALQAKPAAAATATLITPESAAKPVVPAAAPTISEDAIRADERSRIANIEASGRLLGMSTEEVATAVASKQSYGEILAAWHEKKAKAEPPVAQSDITGGEAGADKFEAAAVAALLDRSGHGDPAAAKPAGFAELRHAPLSYIAERCLQASGIRVPQFMAKEQLALMALQMGGAGNVTEYGSEKFGGGPSASGPAFNRPGDFPHLLSNLAGKILDQALQLADTSYEHYTDRIPDVADFKPKTVIQAGQFEELDLLLDDEDPKTQAMLEEIGGWLQVDRFGNMAGLTPVMVANDDLDAFEGQLVSLSYAHDQTLNRLCLSLVTSNVTLLDGVALYHDGSHANDIDSAGAAPSATEMTKHRTKHALQPGVGGRGVVRTPPAIALVPQALSEAAEQTFLTAGVLLEAMLKAPATDSAINVHRGKIKPVVEPELDASSAKKWYTFANPKIRRVIAHAFMKGYGRGGRRTSWFDPARETRYVKLEGRFGAAAVSHRGSVRNKGEN